MKRLSLAYAKTKVVHGYLRLAVHPPPRLFALPGYLHPLEARFLFLLARTVPRGGNVVEIGSFKGKSSSFLAAGLTEDARLTCVDTWMNDAMPDETADVLPEFLVNTAPYSARIDVKRGRSSELAEEWDRPVDLLFIDGDHSYVGCKADIQAWTPYLRPGSWIAFHDSDRPDVAKAVADFTPPFRWGSEFRVWSILAGKLACAASLP